MASTNVKNNLEEIYQPEDMTMQPILPETQPIQPVAQQQYQPAVETVKPQTPQPTQMQPQVATSPVQAVQPSQPTTTAPQQQKPVQQPISDTQIMQNPIPQYQQAFAQSSAVNDYAGMIKNAKLADEYRASVGQPTQNDNLIQRLTNTRLQQLETNMQQAVENNDLATYYALQNEKTQYDTGYKSSYKTALDSLTNELLNMKFVYDPNTDLSLKQAQEYATRQVMEEMNKRGILNSSITAERVAKVVSDLMPQYRKMAQDEFNANLSRLMQVGNYIQNLDDRQYQIYKDNITQRQNELEQYRKNVENAWVRTEQLGYVDNKSSLILGLPVGTLSKTARERKEDLEDKIKLMDYQFKQELAMTTLKDELETKQKYTSANISKSSGGTKGSGTATNNGEKYTEGQLNSIFNSYTEKGDWAGAYLFIEDALSSGEITQAQYNSKFIQIENAENSLVNNVATGLDEKVAKIQTQLDKDREKYKNINLDKWIETYKNTYGITDEIANMLY